MPSLIDRPTKANQKQKAENIIEKVSDYYQVPISKIKGKSRKRDYVVPRFLSIFFIKRCTKLTLKEIGQLYDRDHSSIIHTIKVINTAKSLHYETDLTENYEKLKEIFKYY